MINPVTESPPLLTSQGAQESGMGRNDFLKLLVAQLKHQDPLKPMENTEFVSQLAQFSSLEQTMGINSRLDLLALQSKGQSNTDAVSFIGKRVSVVGSTVALDGSGTGTPVAFELAGNAAKTSVVVRDKNGNTVRTLELGARTPGQVATIWDGKNNAGIVQPAGNYTISVNARSADDASVYASQKTQGTVTGVSYENGFAVLTLDSGVTAPISDLVEVTSLSK